MNQDNVATLLAGIDPGLAGVVQGASGLGRGEGLGPSVLSGLKTLGGASLGGFAGSVISRFAFPGAGPIAGSLLPVMGQMLGARAATPSATVSEKTAFAAGQDRALFETRSKLKDKLRAKMNGVGWKEQSKAPSLVKSKP